MPDHYYSNVPVSRHDRWEISARLGDVEAHFTTDAGVFSRDALDDGTRILLEALPDLRGAALDLGCGWGAVGVLLKKKHPDLTVLMTDINTRAAELAKENCARNGISNEVRVSDGFESITETFDAIITNPPIRAGKAVIYRMFADAAKHLLPGGCLYIVIRKQQGAPSALKELKMRYADVEIISREKGFWVIRASQVL